MQLLPNGHRILCAVFCFPFHENWLFNKILFWLSLFILNSSLEYFILIGQSWCSVVKCFYMMTATLDNVTIVPGNQLPSCYFNVSHITLVSFFSHSTMIIVKIFHFSLFIQEILQYERKLCFNLWASWSCQESVSKTFLQHCTDMQFLTSFFI